jgi:hypothetical protein
MKNKLITIGFIGFKKCYLNVTKEEAINRYLSDPNNLGIEDNEVKEFEFDDEFEAYDCWAK